MTLYLGGEDSGVVGYQIGDGSITVEFKKGDTYLYNNTKPGKAHVQEMIKRAKEGKGLSTYINKQVKNNYFKKLKNARDDGDE